MKCVVRHIPNLPYEHLKLGSTLIEDSQFLALAEY